MLSAMAAVQRSLKQKAFQAALLATLPERLVPRLVGQIITVRKNNMSNSNTHDPQNPYTPTGANDPAAELVQLVINWYRGHRNLLTSTQQTNVITAITNVLSGSNKV